MKTQEKFKAGDWIVNKGGEIAHIDDLKEDCYHNTRYYLLWTNGVKTDPLKEFIENDFHLWTIQDAKDGDVLATENFIFIFKNIDNGNGVHYYCQYEISKHEDDNQFDIALPQSLMGRVGDSISHYSPATKEQRETLFKAMHEAGYEWDAEKLELWSGKMKNTSKKSKNGLKRLATQ